MITANKPNAAGYQTVGTDWWVEVRGGSLAQGDYIQDCPVIVVPRAFDPKRLDNEIEIQEQNIIVMTQSCDLMNGKAEFVAACPVYTLQEMEKAIPKYQKKGAWEDVRRGRVEGLHMIAGFHGPQDNATSLLVDFRQIYSLPFEFLSKFTKDAGIHKRLQSPYLERLSQSFARFFMRVGVPSDIKSFTL